MSWRFFPPAVVVYKIPSPTKILEAPQVSAKIPGLGNGRNTVSRVLFLRRELFEFYGKLGEFCEKLGEFALAHK